MFHHFLYTDKQIMFWKSRP